MALIWLTSRRDLSWRKRRLVMSVAGTAMTFAVTLLLTGVLEGIHLEARRTIRGFGADAFVLNENASGPFTSLAQVPSDAAALVEQLPGVEEAGAIVSVRQTITSPSETDVYVIGAEPDRVGMPDGDSIRGRAPRRRGEAAVGTAADRDVGDRVQIGELTFDIVGEVPGTSVWLNIPVMYVTLADAQALVFNGAPAATAIVTRGVPAQQINGLKTISPDEALTDLKRPLDSAIDNIVLIQLLLWIVAAAIVGSILYISAVERTREFAVFKAFGTRDRDLAGILIVEALVISLASGVGGTALSRPLGRLFPALLSFPAWTALLLPGIALVVGVIGALAGARRAMAVDPAEAFASR